MNIKNIKSQHGLSLIELMIAITLGIFITGGMIQLFINSKQSYRVQEGLSRVQENARLATTVLARDLRTAGYFGCLKDDSTIVNNLNVGSVYDDYASPIDGSNDAGLNTSDSISVTSMTPVGVFVTTPTVNPAAPLIATDNSNLQQGDVVMVLDCLVGDLFQITNDPSASGGGQDTLNHAIGGGGPGNVMDSLQKSYGLDAQVYKARNVTYTIAANPAGRPALYQSVNGAAAQELVEGVESMQILYGEDTDADYTANYYVPSDSGGLDMDQVVSIRVSLLVSSLEDNLTSTNASTVLGPYNSPNDRKIRRVFTATFTVRNRLP